MAVEQLNRYHVEWGAIKPLLPRLSIEMRMRLGLRVSGLDVQDDQSLYLNLMACIDEISSDYLVATAGPCIVGYNVFTPWWSNSPIMTEEFIIRYRDGNFADTLTDLEQHAKSLGCTSLVISSLAAVRQESYGHYLKRKGFTEAAREYIKEIDTWAD